MLKNRLAIGTLMTLIFAGLILLDGFLDGSFCSDGPVKPIQASILCLLLIAMSFPAQLEMKSLVSKTNVSYFYPIVTLMSIAFSTTWYWSQFVDYPGDFRFFYFIFVTICSIFIITFYQGLRFAGSNMIINCSVNLFSIFYIGFLSSFVLGIRIEQGLWAFIMFIITVKCSDIGAYATGKNFGKTKFSPKISPGKTWEGVAGGCLLAAIVAISFSRGFGIMEWWLAGIFGVVFGILGQCGDLIESMIKRDAQQKDSSGHLPGFGGLLDVIDSPLATAPVAYCFFKWFVN